MAATSPWDITALANGCLNWRAVDDLSPIIAVDAVKNDFNLSHSRYVSTGGPTQAVPLDEAMVELRGAGQDFESANRELETVLKELELAE